MNFWPKIKSRFRRDASRLLARDPLRIILDRPIISFTFDDFPKSALRVGGPLLQTHGFAGTFYASFGLMGQTTGAGEIFTTLDLSELIRSGHELGCHTFDHCHAWNTSPAAFDASIQRNKSRAAELFPDVALRSLSYPISGPRPATKRCAARHYPCARGGGQTFNQGLTDARFLKAFFLEQANGNWSAVQRVIENCVHHNGWLIFATHDVCDHPTRFGCTPTFFAQIVNYVAKSGARVLPVGSAFQFVSESAERCPAAR